MVNDNLLAVTLAIPMGDGTKMISTITAQHDESFDAVVRRQPEATHFLIALRKNFPQRSAHLNGRSTFGEMMDAFMGIALDSAEHQVRTNEAEKLQKQFKVS